MQKANALDANGTALANVSSTLSPTMIPLHIPEPILSDSDKQTITNAALNVPEIKAWSDKWQFIGMDFNGTMNPIVWKQAIVLLYSPPDANTPLKCDNGWTARVQVDLATKQVTNAWYPTKESFCYGKVQTSKVVLSDGSTTNITSHTNILSGTSSTKNGFSVATQNDVASNTEYGNAI